MRKQYHFQPGSSGLDAWDIDRLIALSSDLPVKQVPIASLWQLDTVYWTEPFTVRKFAEHVQLVDAVDLSYPIILAADGHVMDGMHRIVRRLVEGAPTIAAVQFAETPQPDYRDCQPEDLPYPDDTSS
jgi:hypothetical protein